MGASQRIATLIIVKPIKVEGPRGSRHMLPNGRYKAAPFAGGPANALGVAPNVADSWLLTQEDTVKGILLFTEAAAAEQRGNIRWE